MKYCRVVKEKSMDFCKCPAFKSQIHHFSVL